MITVALDQSAEAARPFIERARPTHPALIDTEHRVAALFGMINIPTAVWIDEQGVIVRPPAIEHGSDQFKAFHGLDHEPHLAALDRWVRDGTLPMTAEAAREGQLPPTPDEQLARTEFTLAWHLHRAGMAAAAERHFEEAGRLAPFDWTIRRGSMPIRGQDPMGAEFIPLWQEYEAAGRPGYDALARRRRAPTRQDPS